MVKRSAADADEAAAGEDSDADDAEGEMGPPPPSIIAANREPACFGATERWQCEATRDSE